MLAYAADNPRPASRAGSPKALTLVIAGHAALVMAVLTVKMDVVGPVIDEIPEIINIRQPPPPPPPPPPTDSTRQSTKAATQQTFIGDTPPKVDMEQLTPFEFDTGATLGDIGAVIGSGPTTIDLPRHVPVKIAAVSRTPDSAVKPPYPNDKLRLEEEATLKLKLTIDARGRVTAVDPVGGADPSFLEAARRHIIRAWRYKPATEDGVAVPSTMVVNLSFRLEEV